MSKHVNAITMLVILLLMVELVSACSLVGKTGSSRQLEEQMATYAFDENRAIYGQRIATTQTSNRPRIFGLNPYFGR